MIYRFLVTCFILFSHVSFAHEHDKGTYFPFTENKGQWNDNVRFKTEVNGSAIFFEKDAFHYQFRYIPDYHAGNVPDDTIAKGHVFKAIFLESNPNVFIEKEGKSSYYYNYFLGNDKNKWKSKVFSHHEITYNNLYQGIDLRVYSHEGSIKYDYILAPQSDPNQIKVQYKGVKTPTIKDGQLIVKHSLGDLIEEKPYAYQLINGKKIEVVCNYVIHEDGSLGFVFPKQYDTTKELIIDPVLIFSTYSGSSVDNFGETATFDNLGNGYMGGIAQGAGYITTLGAFQSTFGGGTWDIAITKFDSTGANQIYSTYIGGSGNETVHSLVVDDSLNLFLLGATNSTNYPTSTNAHSRLKFTSAAVQTDIFVNFNGGADIIISKFDSAGALAGSTYFGGNDNDGLNINPVGPTSQTGLNFNYGDYHRGEINLDSAGNCYIGTTTLSSNITGSLNSNSGGQDGLVAKFNSDLSQLIWARYLGGANRDAIYSLKVIDSNKVLVGGGTTSFTDFPTTLGAYQENASMGEADGFISIISEDGTTVERSTYIGTSNYDQVYFIEFDRFNNVYGYGQSRGGLFPVKNAPRADTASRAGQFFIKLDQNLDSVILASTFGNGLGTGEVNISPTAFLVDRCQNMYAAGWGGSIDNNKTLPSNMPLANAAPQFQSTDGEDFYLYVLRRDADSIFYASFIGGSSSGDHVDGGTSRFDKDGIVYHSVCASCGTSTSDFPTTANAFSRIDNSGNCNNALFKFDFQILINASFQLSETEICLSPGGMDSVRVTNTSSGATSITYDFYGDTVVSNFTDTVIFFDQPGVFTIQQVVFDSICAIGDFLNLTVTVRPDDINLVPSFDSLVCFSDSTTIIAPSGGNANRFEFSVTDDFSTLLNTSLNDSILKVGLTPGINKFFIRASNPTTNACEQVDSIEISYTPINVSAFASADSVCEGTPIQFNATVQNVDTFQWRFGDGTISTNLNPNYNYPTPGAYQAFFAFENDMCSERDSIPFNINIVANDLSFAIPDDTLFCGTGTFNFSATSSGTITSFVYSSNANFTDTINPNISVNSLSFNSEDSANYFIRISNDLCSLEDSIIIEYVEYDVDLFTLPDSICTPLLAQVSSTIIGADSFRILLNNQTLSTTNPTPFLNFNTPGLFNLQLLASNAKCGISDTLSTQTNVFEGVQIQPILDTLICVGNSVPVTANTSGTASNFIWDDNANFSSPIQSSTDSLINLQPNSTTTYHLRAENAFCDATASFTIETELVDIEVDDFTSFCIKDTIDIEAIVNIASSPLSFEWKPVDSILSGANLSTITISPNSNLRYTVEVTSATGCKDFDTIEVNVNLPAFDDAIIFADDDSLFKGQQAQLSTNRNGSNLSYEWEPANLVNDPNSPTPRANPDSSQIYQVTITDLNTGCTVVAFKRLAVFEINCGEPDIFIPTAFTPNQDLSNDVLFVRGNNVSSIHLQLFNRWGELVFETQDQNVGWDGTFKGKAVNPGVFAYQLRAICFDGQEFYKKGNITLIK